MYPEQNDRAVKLDSKKPRWYAPVFEHAPQWFIGIFGITYLCGYLIEFFFFAARFGITDPASDILKLKYVQTGLGFVIFVFILTGPSTVQVLRGLLIWKFAPEKVVKTKAAIMSACSSLLVLVYMASLYFTFIFTPADYFEGRRTLPLAMLLILVLVQVVTLYVVKSFETKNQTAGEKDADNLQRPDPERAYDRFREALKSLSIGEKKRIKTYLIVSCIVVALTTYTLWEIRFILWEMFWTRGGIFVFGLCGVLALHFARFSSRAKRKHLPGGHASYTITMTSIVVVLFALTVFGYSYSILQYIPSAKGGTDFTQAYRSSVKFWRGTNSSYNTSEEHNLILVYATSNSFYFARIEYPTDPCEWRTGKQPNIVQILHRQVETIEIRRPEKENRIPCPVANRGNLKSPVPNPPSRPTTSPTPQ